MEAFCPLNNPQCCLSHHPQLGVSYQPNQPTRNCFVHAKLASSALPPAQRLSLLGKPNAAAGCGRRSSIPELEDEGLEKVKALGLEEEGEGEGVVELMECLEQEAIMGEDEGREPTDYNRRAEIFDKSSRVFKALRTEKLSSVHNDEQHQHQA